jgi:hypothetical protein
MSQLHPKIRENLLLLLFIVGLTILIAMRDIAGMSINKFIYWGYTSIFIFSVQKETLIYILSFLFPLLWGLPSTYILLVALIIYIFKSHSINKNVLFLTVFFIFLEGIASLFYLKPDYVLIVKYLLALIIFFLLLYEEDSIDYMRCMQLFLYGSTVLCLVIIISTFISGPSDWFNLFSKGLFRFGDVQVDETTNMVLALNANSLAYYSITGLSLGIVLFENQTTKSSQVITILCMIVHFFAGVLALSRSWLLVTVICILFLLYDSKKSWKSIFMACSVLSILIFLGMWYLDKNPYILQGFMTRFEDDNVQTAGGRVGLFEAYMNLFLDNTRYLFMGTGVTQYKSVTGVYNSLHNGIEQILVCYGIPGMLIFLFGMLNPLRYIGKKDLLYWIPFIAVVLFVQTIQFINPETLIFPYIIAIFSLRFGAQKYSKNHLIINKRIGR